MALGITMQTPMFFKRSIFDKITSFCNGALLFCKRASILIATIFLASNGTITPIMHIFLLNNHR